MNHTPNYALNQWEATDKIQRTDFNADNAKIDAALAGLQAVAAAKGNCQIAWGTCQTSITSSAENPAVFTFPFQPKLVVFAARGAASAGDYALAIRGQTRICNLNSGSSTESCVCNWTENGFTLHYYTSSSVRPFNSNFLYVALG